MDDKAVFYPGAAAIAAFKRLSDAAYDAMSKDFFDMWEAEGDPRKAGSMAAHAYIKNAAKFALFGAQCAAVEPDRDKWMAACAAAYDEAREAVAIAFTTEVSQPKT